MPLENSDSSVKTFRFLLSNVLHLKLSISLTEKVTLSWIKKWKENICIHGIIHHQIHVAQCFQIYCFTSHSSISSFSLSWYSYTLWGSLPTVYMPLTLRLRVYMFLLSPDALEVWNCTILLTDISIKSVSIFICVRVIRSVGGMLDRTEYRTMIRLFHVLKDLHKIFMKQCDEESPPSDNQNNGRENSNFVVQSYRWPHSRSSISKHWTSFWR